MLLPRTVCSTCSWRGATVHCSLLLLLHYLCLSSSSSSSPTLVALVFSVDAKRRNVDAIYSTFPIRLLWLVHRRYLLWTKLTFRSRRTWTALEEQHFGRHSTSNASQYKQQQKQREWTNNPERWLAWYLFSAAAVSAVALYEIRDHLCSHQSPGVEFPAAVLVVLVCSLYLSLSPVSQSVNHSLYRFLAWPGL